MPQLTLENLKKSFRSSTVLDGVSLEAAAGEIIAVFGPSGTGKTVLLRLIAGIEDPDSGRVLMEGRDVTDENSDQRGVGMAFQNFALFPHFSAYDNVASGLTAKSSDKSMIASKVDQIARLLKIEHVLNHAPKELSNGQKQRTALARALISGPKVLLLDDPLRNVDAKLRYEMRLELPNLLRKFGSTVLYVTQDYKEAMAIADRIAVLQGGTIVQIARPAEIYERPANVDVARLFGDPTLNLVPVEPVLNGAGTTVTIANARIPLAQGYETSAGAACTLGLRPESLRISGDSGEDAIAVDVLAVTPLNEKIVLLMQTPDGREMLASTPGGSERPPEPGPAFVRFDPRSALLFERDSGRRVEPQGAAGPRP